MKSLLRINRFHWSLIYASFLCLIFDIFIKEFKLSRLGHEAVIPSINYYANDLFYQERGCGAAIRSGGDQI